MTSSEYSAMVIPMSTRKQRKDEDRIIRKIRGFQKSYLALQCCQSTDLATNVHPIFLINNYGRMARDLIQIHIPSFPEESMAYGIGRISNLDVLSASNADLGYPYTRL